ncbi:calmodulin-binding transcription activator 3-like isoform X3 [Olea europaea var. sylvestris]|uniref:calmodulin-binding transcription activator 3-like isoform X3 n=1 Tax=Olea europaea var. sylvestris TaxID=158386 RepID=UPI000C1D5AAF|nr:calmodulin-binding transcription activator 3-like isoform X3 [Olea europaea var. sylvestris]
MNMTVIGFKVSQLLLIFLLIVALFARRISDSIYMADFARELSHIVLVHYRDVKGNRTNFSRNREAEVIHGGKETEEDVHNSEVDSSVSSKFYRFDYQGTSQVTDTTSLNSAQASEYEDAESDNCKGQLTDSADMSFESVTGERVATPMDNGLTHGMHQDLDFSSWENVKESSTAGYQSLNVQPSISSSQPSMMSMMLGQENELLAQVFDGDFGKKQDFGSNPDGFEEWQTTERDSAHLPWSMVHKSHQGSGYDTASNQNNVKHMELRDSMGPNDTYPAEQSEHPVQNLQTQSLNPEVGSSLKSETDGNLNMENKANYPALRQPRVDGVLREGLRKLDSFDRWMSKELGDVTETHMQPSSGADWETVDREVGVDDSGISSQVPLDNYILGPSLSQDQLFSILDFLPNWAYAGSENKVLIMGRFLKSQEEVGKYKWACMFGELEVPAEVITDGVLGCHTPLHESGRVPFYITCSNRLACSEVREFEFRTRAAQDMDVTEIGSSESDEALLHMRFGKLLSLGSVTPQTSHVNGEAETSDLCGKISALLKDDAEWEQMLNLTTQDEFSPDKIKDQLLQKLFKEKLHYWLLQNVTEGGKGPSLLDEDGQGVLHFAAALGYDWAIPPTIAAGVSVDFRDANGWTALHWAAYHGRERTVAFLISLGSAPGALTDPTPKYPSGRTPADLASSNGHKGIAGYLAESALSYHLSLLTLKETKEGDRGEKAVETVSKRTATPVGFGDLPHGLSLKDSLAAVRNATQAAARIHEVFRVQSFQRKQLKEYGDGEFGMSDERALSLLAVKTNRSGSHDGPTAAAIRIQNKFRSWKGRKEFLLIRQRVIKIQAHVRGHQVRKNYKKIIWSVGILDKVILRWRRKGRGLSGFKPESPTAGTSMQVTEVKEDDYDFFKEGRKQTEERLHKALARVKSMVQYPEARDQYRRLLNVVSEMQEKKAACDKVLNNPEADFDDDFIDIEALLDEDTFMPTTS